MRTHCFSVIAIALVLPFLAKSQDVDLTFRVDMKFENISSKGVHVAGDFQAAAGFGDNWNPGGTELTDDDSDGIYELTVQVPPGSYLYKFVNGNSWQDKPELPSAACAVGDGGGNFNRQVTVAASGTELPLGGLRLLRDTAEAFGQHGGQRDLTSRSLRDGGFPG